MLLGIFQGQSYAEEHIPIDFEAIKLQPPFIQDTEVTQEFEHLVSDFSQYIHRDLYSHLLIEKLISFISEHPNDEAALSAKFYLAKYLLSSRDKFTLSDDTLWSLVTRDMLKLFNIIASESPNSWQGRVASLYTPELFIALTDRKALLAEIRKSLLLTIEIKDEPGFVKFQKHLGLTRPLEVQVREQVIDLELEQGNIETAEKELLMLRKNYPEQQTKHLEEKISNVRQRQIEKEKSLE